MRYCIIAVAVACVAVGVAVGVAIGRTMEAIAEFARRFDE